nr:MAG TPA: hypothetical protein [Caudoviricetes sp.]
MSRKGRPQRVTGTFPEALKQGRAAMPYQKRRAAALRVRHVVAPRGGQSLLCKAKGRGLVAKRKGVSVWLAERQENGKA